MRATIPVVLFALMCVYAFEQGVRATADVRWPYDPDMCRDIGIAQSILDGRYPADYQYRGETNWYNPATAFVVAATSMLTGLPPPLVDVRIGPYVGLLAPIAFFVMLLVLFDAWVALAGATYMIFGVAHDALSAESWARATYSPWLFAPNFAQPFFYASVAAFAVAIRRREWRWLAATGVGLGLTFVAHTAPALILGGMIAWVTIRQASRGAAAALARFAAIMVIALVVSSVYWLPIFSQYRFHLVRTWHAAWFFTPLLSQNVVALLSSQLTWPNLVAAWGLVALLSRRGSIERTLILVWLAETLVGLVHNYAWQAFNERGVHLPILVPSYHFLLYFSGAKAVLFGYGIGALGRLVAGAVRRTAGTIGERTVTGIERVSVVILLVAAVQTFLPSYRTWFEFVGARSVYAAHRDEFDDFRVYEWMMANTRPDDVFAANHWTGAMLVAPTARKLLCAWADFSNPYAEFDARLADQMALWEGLRRGDRASVLAVATRRDVRWVLAVDDEIAEFERASNESLALRLPGSRVRVYEIRR